MGYLFGYGNEEFSWVGEAFEVEHFVNWTDGWQQKPIS